MRSRLFLVLAGLAGLTGLSWSEGVPAFAGAMAVDMPHYQGLYIEPAISLHQPMAQDAEIDLGLGLGIRMVDEAPYFFIPVQAGISILFPLDNGLEPLMGIGVSPSIEWNPKQFSFCIGPYFKAGLRVRLHPLLKWYAEVQETMMIGPPQWLSASTRIETGFYFKAETPDPARSAQGEAAAGEVK